MSYLDTLNPAQREAVTTTDGPVLILAGAGSGKTRALTSRIAYLIAEKKVRPWEIMAITFTNKAAQEMRERVDKLAGEGASYIWVSTFHSACVRILRRFIDHIGYGKNFTIYDTDDSRTLIKRIMKEKQLDPHKWNDRFFQSRISAAKNIEMTPLMMENQAESPEQHLTAAIYRIYDRRLQDNNALDFDDLLLKTVELFRKDPEVLDYYQERLHYLMVDEYQDTNKVQFEFVSLLAGKYRNLCVVGDDDQSIYRFRGADIRNILEFEKIYPEARVIFLEQNYRSTQPILDAANAVIAHNTDRRKKKLWTAEKGSEKVRFHHFDSPWEEAEYVVSEIGQKHDLEGKPYSDFAILYRTNAQSRSFEEQCIARNIPYRIVGGINFYAHKEIKDILAYLTILENPSDDLSVRRIINVPRRGIGQTSIARLDAYAEESGISFLEACRRADQIPGLKRAAAGLSDFHSLIGELLQEKDELPVSELIAAVFDKTGYLRELEEKRDDESQTRLENLHEFAAKASDFDEQSENSSLSEFLQQVSLVSDIDTVDPSADYILLMTLHAAKGLEFDSVYMTGMEDGIFPGYRAITAEDDSLFGEDGRRRAKRETSEMQEERRLCYVGITRAKRHLMLTAAKYRMLYGERQAFRISRFVREIPRNLIDLLRDTTDTRRVFAQPGSEREGIGRILSFGKTLGTKKEGGNFFSKSGKFRPKEFQVEHSAPPAYKKGDRIRHRKFGEGTVLDIQNGKRDYEVSVDFDAFGTRRMFASFAALEKI